MELRSEFIPKLRIRELEFTVFPSKRLKNDSLIVFNNMFSREAHHVSYDRWKNLEAHCNNEQSIHHLPLHKGENAKHKLTDLSFNRLQPTVEYCGVKKHSFGRFIAREAVLDEEYWAAAWLRAESHWEPLPNLRHVDTYKRNYAEKEFYAIKRRCTGHDAKSLKSFCIVAVKKEEKNVRRTVLNSVVGTLDLCIKQFVLGETYPGEVQRPAGVFIPFDAHKYAYVSNVCVAKFARRQGIATNMLHLAADLAKSEGMKRLYVHVLVKNKYAVDLYSKAGFEIDETAPQVSNEPRHLMSMEL